MHKFLVKLLTIATVTFLYGVSYPLWADDTDIYINTSPPFAGQPMVMFSIDYAPNLGSNIGCPDDNGPCDQLRDAGYLPGAQGSSIIFLELLVAVFKRVLDGVTGVRLGFMINHKDGTGPSCAGPQAPGDKCSGGAYVLSGMRPMTIGGDNPSIMGPADPNDNLEDPNKVALFNKLDELVNIFKTTPTAQHEYQGKELYFEFFRYLTGQGIYNGHNGYQDYGDSGPAANQNLNSSHPTVSWDDAADVENGPNYVSPLTVASECARIYMVNIMFFTSAQEDDSDAAIPLSKANGGMEGIDISGLNNEFSTVIEYMNDADLADGTFGAAPDLDGTQNVISYFIVDPTKINTTTIEYATAGGTNTPYALSEDPQELIDLLSDLFESILSVSTTFVAPSVPVNVFNRSETENEVFLALFRADEQGAPFWPGNLKKLNIVPVTIPDPDPNAAPGDTIESDELRGATVTGGIDGTAAIDTDGRIKLDTLTPWTVIGDTDMDGAIPDEAVDQRDGRAIERGGIGQQMPGFLPVTTGDPGLVNPSPITTPQVNRRIFTELGTVATEIPTSTGLINVNVDATTAEDLWAEITREWTPLQDDFNDGDPSNDTTQANDWNDTRPLDQNRILDALRWIRGLLFVDTPIFDTDTPPDGIPDTGDGIPDALVKRNWFMGDPLHSRPLTINYGARGGYSTTNPDIRIFFGTNDGLFRFIRNTNTDGTQSGQETWAFAPRETIPVWDRLTDNQPGGFPTHPITTDGSASSLVIDFNNDGTINGSDRVFVFVGLRRGGKSYFGFDLTDPDNPILMWRISKYLDPLNPGLGAGNIDSDFAELGQSWSQPVPGFKSFNGGSSIIPILMFAGGYNGDDRGDNVIDTTEIPVPLTFPPENIGLNNRFGKDTPSRDFALLQPPLVGGDDTEGNAFFVVNAVTGNLIWKVSGTGPGNADIKHNEMDDSIPSEVSPLDSDGDGLIDRVYVGDTGGKVWRFDMADNNGTNNWSVDILLDAGRHRGPNRTNDRRFFNPPDIALTADDVGPYDAIMIGSGDRELPKGTDVDNHFFMIKDRGIVSGAPVSNYIHNSTTSSLADLTSNCFIDSSCVSPPAGLDNGWFMSLPTVGDPGEKNLSRSVVLDGVIFFTTFSPSTGVCGLTEGTGKQFGLALEDATPVFDYNTSEDSAPGNPNDLFDKIESGGIPVEPVTLGDDRLLFQGQAGSETVQETGATTSWRTYWYERDSS